LSGAAGTCLREYLAALQSADAEALNRLIGRHTLLENPFLNPARLAGKDEIARAHRAIVERLESIEIDIELVLGDDRHAIASGRMSVTRRGDREREFAIGAVVEMDGDELLRLSLYCDTRDIRRWVDESLL
jgi:limonene-1,2-epoxide hydrolase